ncbi:MAG: hypothetical protein EON94_12490 [Caulobacteraceae bacterium]|nr:MAG: hypothetical protein EON94_12490 [Caulobacteraceae bacterium]
MTFYGTNRRRIRSLSQTKRRALQSPHYCGAGLPEPLPWRTVMNSIIYIVGLVVVVGAILSFVF